MYVGVSQAVIHFSKFLFNILFFFLCCFLDELSFPLLGELIKILFQLINSSLQSDVCLSNECLKKATLVAIFHFHDL